jgi:hypothetical protein
MSGWSATRTKLGPARRVISPHASAHAAAIKAPIAPIGEGAGFRQHRRRHSVPRVGDAGRTPVCRAWPAARRARRSAPPRLGYGRLRQFGGVAGFASVGGSTRALRGSRAPGMAAHAVATVRLSLPAEAAARATISIRRTQTDTPIRMVRRFAPFECFSISSIEIWRRSLQG